MASFLPASPPLRSSRCHRRQAGRLRTGPARPSAAAGTSLRRGPPEPEPGCRRAPSGGGCGRSSGPGASRRPRVAGPAAGLSSKLKGDRRSGFPGPAPLFSPIIAKGRSCYLRVPDFHICTTRGALQLSRALLGEALRRGRAEGPHGTGGENSPPRFSCSWTGPTRRSRPSAGCVQPSRTCRHRPCKGQWQLGLKQRCAPS